MSLSLAFALTATPIPCIPVNDDQVYGRDLARYVPALSALPDSILLGYTPAPGVRRVFSANTLRHLAQNQGVELQTSFDVCVERPLVRLEADAVREAILTSLSEREGDKQKIRLDLVEWGPKDVPSGKVVFPRTGIPSHGGLDPETPLNWRGYVLYGNNRRLPVWANVRSAIATTRVVATVALQAGQPIQQGQVRVESCETAVTDLRPARNLDEVVGLLPRNFIPAGATVLRGQLVRSPDVNKGDNVTVEVASGKTRLVLQAQAQSAGNAGATVWLRNLTSGKEFRGRVSGRGKVVVAPIE